MPPGHVHAEGCAVIPESDLRLTAPRTPTSHVDRLRRQGEWPDLVERVSLKAEGRRFDLAPDHWFCSVITPAREPLERDLRLRKSVATGVSRVAGQTPGLLEVVVASLASIAIRRMGLRWRTRPSALRSVI
jgi:hypothetical protein